MDESGRANRWEDADVAVRANFELLLELLEEQGVDALLTFGRRNCSYLAGHVGVHGWGLGSYDVSNPAVVLDR